MRQDRRPLKTVEAVFRNRRAVILGKPGSGKSTFAKYLLYCLATAQTDPNAALLTNFWDSGWRKREKGWLPVFVVLRDFDAWLRNLDPQPRQATTQHLHDFIHHMLAPDKLEYARDVIDEALEDGKALIVLDGLDEVPSVQMREFVRDAVTRFIKHYKGNRYILTCRSKSYLPPDADSDAPDLRISALDSEFALADLEFEQIEQFIGLWYQELQHTRRRTPAEAERKRLTLLDNLRRYDLLDLAANPLQLTLMAWVHTEDELPQKRARLYDRAIDLLLWQWEKAKRDPVAESSTLENLAAQIEDKDRIKFALAEAAFLAHGQMPSLIEESEEDDNRAVLADVSEEAFEKLLYPLKKIGGLPDKNWAQAVVRAIKERSGLLAPRQPGSLTFPHRTFQEYLAGAHLLRQRDFVGEADRLADQQLSLWKQVIVMAVGKSRHRDDQEIYRDAEPLARRLLAAIESSDADLAWRKVTLAGEVLLEAGAVARVKPDESSVQDVIKADEKADAKLLRQTREALTALVQQGRLTPRERVAAANTLARLGDPRFDPDRWHLPKEPSLGFVHIPAVPFLMGTRKLDFEPLMTALGVPKDDWKYCESEINPQPETQVDEFYIARYPVTVAQFRAFVDERRAADPKFKLKNDDALHGLDTHPVRYVTWHESMAYCDWLQQRLQADGPDDVRALLNTGWRVSLPSEAEWEKAARGGLQLPSPTGRGVGGEGENPNPSRIFTWEDDQPDPNKANYGDTGIGSVSPAGCFPDDGNVYGLRDLIGNVWEWTRRVYKPYPYEMGDGRENDDAPNSDDRSLRGGAFNLIGRDARVAYRLRLSPDNYFLDGGFRVVVPAHFSASGR